MIMMMDEEVTKNKRAYQLIVQVIYTTEAKANFKIILQVILL